MRRQRGLDRNYYNYYNFVSGIFWSLGVWEYRSLDDTDVGGIRDLDRNYYNYYNFVSARSDLQSDHYEYEHL